MSARINDEEFQPALPSPVIRDLACAKWFILVDVSANVKKNLSKLSQRGPHRVLTGDLAYAGLDGVVYTPAEGNGLPAVAFGHDWTKHVKNYHETLRHLASWGIVVAAPNTERSAFPDHRGLASDLNTTLQILAGVKLGEGNATVNPRRLSLAGHGMGAGAAVLAAANKHNVQSVAAIFPAETSPSSYAAARTVTAPGLVIGSDMPQLFSAGNPAKLAYNWKGNVAYREVDNLLQQQFTEDRFVHKLIGLGAAKGAALKTVRALVTGFFLDTLHVEGKLDGFSAADAEGPHVKSFSGEKLAEKAGPSRDAI